MGSKEVGSDDESDAFRRELDGLDLSAWNTILSSVSRLYSSVAIVVAAVFFSITVLVQRFNSLGTVLWAIVTLASINTAGAWLVSVPRKARRAPEYEPPLLFNQLVSTVGVRPPRLVIYGPIKKTAVQLRGGRLNPTLLISPKSAVLWHQDEKRKYVQMMHELGHCIAADSQRHGRVGASVVVTFILFALAINSLGRPHYADIVFYGGLLFLALASWRAYGRFREHVADFLASLLLGRDMFDSIPDSKDSFSLDRGLTILATHPSTRARREVLSDPSNFFRGITWGICGFSVAVTYLSSILPTVLVGIMSVPRAVGILISVALGYLLILLVLGPVFWVSSALALGRHQEKWWFRSLLGSSVLFWILVSNQFKWPGMSMLFVCAILVVCSSRMLTFVAEFTAATLLLPNYLRKRWLAAIHGVAPATFWAAIYLLLVGDAVEHLANLLSDWLPLV